MSDSKDLYSMKLHESISINTVLDIVRVPGGWIYRTGIDNGNGYDLSQSFVPYHNEFDDRDAKDLP
jgi:hypothetical protein